jgi:hypothetical protein
VAHRVAHLIVNGADPRRVLLMTFSRRAAFERTPWPEAEPKLAARDASQGLRVDIASRMRGMWR